MRVELLSGVKLARRYTTNKIPSQNSNALAKERYNQVRRPALIDGECAQVAACRRHDGKYVAIVYAGRKGIAGERCSPSQPSSHACTYPSPHTFTAVPILLLSYLVCRAHIAGVRLERPVDSAERWQCVAAPGRLSRQRGVCRCDGPLRRGEPDGGSWSADAPVVAGEGAPRAQHAMPSHVWCTN